MWLQRDRDFLGSSSRNPPRRSFREEVAVAESAQEATTLSNQINLSSSQIEKSRKTHNSTHNVWKDVREQFVKHFPKALIV